MVSAHRGGVGGTTREGTVEALAAAATSGVDLVEMDVQRSRDGAFVLLHDDVVRRDGGPVAVADLDVAEVERLVGRPLTRLGDAVAALAGQVGAHVDLKLTSPPGLYADPATTWEVEATRQVLDAVGPGGAIITTLSDASVAAVRSWARATGCDDLLVGLSLGRDPREVPWWRAPALVLSELFPGRRLAACGANLVVAERTRARLTVARWARRHGVPLLVWTVDDDRGLRSWLRPGRAAVVATNRPARALALRGVERRRPRQRSRA